MTGESKSRNYRINPDFVVPEPTAADMFSHCKITEYSLEKHNENCRWMAEAGATQFRLTIVSDEYPNPPYPHGYYWEGWRDPVARMVPFGEAEKPGGAIYPPLTDRKAR